MGGRQTGLERKGNQGSRVEGGGDPLLLDSPLSCGCLHGFQIQHESLSALSSEGRVPEWSHHGAERLLWA